MANSRNDDEQIVDRILKSTDYFSALDVKNTCSEEELTTAYKNLVLKVHPDKNTTPRAHDAFIALHKAYDTLKDPTKRLTYVVAMSWRSVILVEEAGGPRENQRPVTSIKIKQLYPEYEQQDLNSTPQSSTSNTYNQYHTDTDSTRQRKPSETDENNTNQFRKSTQYTPRRKAKTHKKSTAKRYFSRRFWIYLLAGLLFLFLLWVIPELNHTSPRKTPKQSSTSISSSEIFELWKTEIFNVKMITKKLKIPFYVERGYHPKSGVELLDLWERVEKASSIN